MRTSHDQRLVNAADTTMAETINRIVATFRQATPSDIEAGATWYANGEILVGDLAKNSAYSRETVAAVIAHLSPRTQWARNVAGATVLLMSSGTARPEGCMSANVDRALKAMESFDPLATLRGPKTRRFAANLLGDRESVTVDVWTAHVALGEHDTTGNILARVGVYDAIEHAYRLAARRLGVDPTTCQATCWIVSRNGRSA